MSSGNNCGCNNLGRNLNAVAVATANILSANFNDQEIGLLSAFFTVLGDALAMVTAANECTTNEIVASDATE